ncbi:hypothetical protein HDV00_004678 [Rhizophlyctis rosea]|nr:hypothetical protein HDV00_004678 [Rhizophlyctis rosea]
MPLSDQVILVTGASKGLGLAIVQACLKYGAKVVGISRSPATLPDLTTLTTNFPTQFHYISTDLISPTAAASAVSETLSHFGALTAVVHNAGGIEPLKKIADSDLDEWRKLFELNFFSGVDLIQRSLPHLRKASANGGGRIIIVSSGAATRATAGWNPYCTTKAAVNMLVAGLGLEEKDVTSIAVRPGMTVTSSFIIFNVPVLIEYIAGVIDTEMQVLIREKGEEAMDAASYSRFTTLKNEGKLLPPELPGTAIARLALAATKDFSGQFVQWDDERIKGFPL